MFAAVLALGLAAGPALAQEEPQIKVMVDHAHVMRLPEKTSTVIIGNPIIADISLHKNGVVVVTGKSFGVTNLIVLDAEGAIVSQSLVSVTAPRTEDLVLVQRGFARETYSCNPVCMPSIVLGDAPGHYEGTGKQVGAHRALSTGVR
jgi:hypothetical protein